MERPISDRVLAAHVLTMVIEDRARGRASRLDDLSVRLGVRREDVRGVLSKLHREGLFDVVRMKVTMEGFAIGCRLAGVKLKRVRRNGPRRAGIAA